MQYFGDFQYGQRYNNNMNMNELHALSMKTKEFVYRHDQILNKEYSCYIYCAQHINLSLFNIQLQNCMQKSKNRQIIEFLQKTEKKQH